MPFSVKFQILHKMYSKILQNGNEKAVTAIQSTVKEKCQETRDGNFSKWYFLVKKTRSITKNVIAIIRLRFFSFVSEKHLSLF